MFILESEKKDHLIGKEKEKSYRDSKRNNGNVAKHANKQPIDNPYYEGYNEVCVESKKKKCEIIPNLNDTDIVTATQNVYYEL